MDVERYAITGDFDGLVIDVGLVVLHLGTGENGFPPSALSTLMEDSNDFTLLGGDDSATGANWNVGNLMVVKDSDVHRAFCFRNGSNIVAENAAIGAAIHQSFWFVGPFLLIHHGQLWRSNG